MRNKFYLMLCYSDLAYSKFTSVSIFQTGSPNAKKLRLERLADVNSPLESALKGLTSEQLIGIIQSIITKHSDIEEVCYTSIHSLLFKACAVWCSSITYFLSIISKIFYYGKVLKILGLKRVWNWQSSTVWGYRHCS